MSSLFIKELIHLIADPTSRREQLIMLAVLGLIDVVMISNLLVMVIVGGYEAFVSRLRLLFVVQGRPGGIWGHNKAADNCRNA
jgi:uncharacterized protein (TIGR00645 family)